MPNKSDQTIDHNAKNFQTESEMKKFLAAARKTRHGVRVHWLMLMAFRHGLRVSELIDIRLKDLDVESSRIFVRRLKGSLLTHQPIEGDELRAIRAWLRIREDYPNAGSNYLFLSERGMMTRQAINYLVTQIGRKSKLDFRVTPHSIRHSTGYYLANKGYDTRLIKTTSDTKTSLIRFAIREPPPQGLKDYGDKILWDFSPDCRNLPNIR